MKVFLSYGHDRNTPLIERISDDLRAAGHTVWVDTSEIKGGDDWRRRIVDGLLDSDWTLAFLSKHSTREPGVCLDELAIALHVKGGMIATVLVEAELEVSQDEGIFEASQLRLRRAGSHFGRSLGQNYTGGPTFTPALAVSRPSAGSSSSFPVGRLAVPRPPRLLWKARPITPATQ